MKLAEFGQLIKTLRKTSLDECGNPWTRASLSRAIHLTQDQLGRLERGDRKYLDTQTLNLLTKAFKLTNLEKREFLYAATSLGDERLFENEDPESHLNKLMCEMEKLQVPALLIDAYSDIVAINKAALNLFLVTPELLNYLRQVPAGQNLINLLYSPAFGSKEIFGSFWRRVATIEILLFRRSTLRYRHTDYFDYIYKILTANIQFDIDWYSSQRNADHYDLTYEHFNYNHPRYGPLSYLASETIINSSKGELYMLVYNPTNSVTSSVFRKLVGVNSNEVYNTAAWPDKVIPSNDSNEQTF